MLFFEKKVSLLYFGDSVMH